MGKADKVLKEYFQDPAVFADAFNYLLADSGLRVDPALLREMDSDQVVLAFGLDAAVVTEKFRDLLRAMVSMTDGKAAYLILGIENQMTPHLAMPVRNMLYDAMRRFLFCSGSFAHWNPPPSFDFPLKLYDFDRS